MTTAIASRLSATQTCGLHTKPLEGANFGLEVLGLDPSNISDTDKAEILEANGRAHGLLCFSFDRLLQAQELHALTRVFGASEYAPGIINGLGKLPTREEEHLTAEQQIAIVIERGEDPFITYVGNVDPTTLDRISMEEGFYGEWEWHTDMSYVEVPPTFSIMHARLVPELGADTGYCDQVMAAASLPKSLRDRVRNLKIKHDATFASDGSLRPGMDPTVSAIESVGYPHPVVRVMPESGEEAMYLGRRTNGYVPGSSLEESERLLDELWAHATQEQFCYRHRWQVGQVVAWDNRRLMHKRYPMDAELERFMWRTQTKGEAVHAMSK